MEEHPIREPRPNPDRPARPRRRKRSKWQNFKEAYLPVIILAVAVILIITFVVGAIRRSSGDSRTEPVASESTADSALLLQQEQEELLAKADALAAQYDYQAAMDVLGTYSAGLTSSTTLVARYNEYNEAMSQLVPFSDLSQIPNVAVRMLIADLPRALADPDYGSGFGRNYITTGEFSAMLEQLYANGYMLVSPYDLVTSVTAGDGSTRLAPGTVYLPEGKKPLVLTQLGCNYFTYIVDSDGDGLPDKDGSGMPYRVALDENGELTAQIVDRQGNDLSGAYDFITILNDFVKKHPDFSYRGARGVLAVTGYDGLFGYRTDPETAEKIGQAFYDTQLQEVPAVIEKIRADGFDIACMSYDYVNYGSKTADEVRKDLEDWATEVTPLLGNVDLMVMPYEDIVSGREPYSGDKYDLLIQNGFRFFMAENDDSNWGEITDHYARMNFRIVTAETMSRSPRVYSDLFDASAVLDPSRGAD